MCYKQSNLSYVFWICQVTLLKGVYLDMYYFSSLFMSILKYPEPLLKPVIVHSAQENANCYVILTCTSLLMLRSPRQKLLLCRSHSPWVTALQSSPASLLWFLHFARRSWSFPLAHVLDTLDGNRAITTISIWQLFLSKPCTIILLRVKRISASPGKFFHAVMSHFPSGMKVSLYWVNICLYADISHSGSVNYAITLYFLIFEIYKPSHIYDYSA